MSTAKKNTPPPLELPARPPSKVEAGLKAEQAEPQWIANEREADAAADTPEAKRERAIAAMVEAGLSQEFAEASFVLEGASAADVAEAVGELEVSTAPLCGCHGDSWADVRAELVSVSCEHGTYSR